MFGLLGQPYTSFATEPRLELVDCPSLSPTVTNELLSIELRSLGISASSAMLWKVRCHGQAATLALREGRDELSSRELDLSSTDQAAWPRLVAISASELVEQRLRSTLPLALPKRANLPRVRVVSFDATNKRKLEYRPYLGFTASRIGNPATWLTGMNLGGELVIGRAFLIGTDVRGQWGTSRLPEATVNWQLIGLNAFGGACTLLGPVELSAILGVQFGRVALTGEATTADASGRKLSGPTGGPFAAVRLRVPVVGRWFVSATLEEGYGFMPVRGNYDGVAPLVTVNGAWTSGLVNTGWSF